MNHSVEAVRNQARELFARDGELEIDEGDPINQLDDGTYEVRVWVWVSNDAAGIENNDDHDEDDRSEHYLRVALANDIATDAEFQDDAIVSLGDDDGSYVCGWVCFGMDNDEHSEAA